MNYKIHLRIEVVYDIIEIRLWYKEQSQSAAKEFMKMLKRTITYVKSNPLMYPIVHQYARRALLHHFPYSLLYEVNDDVIGIVGCFHTSRDPQDWKERIESN